MSDAARGRDPIVLYVDDDDANRIVFEQTFKQRFPLTIAHSGDQAIDILEKHAVAVLLTDQRMPGMSGNELLKLVAERSPETVGIIITAFDDVEPLLEAVNKQLAKRYILKPWSAREIETVVTWGIEVYRLGRQKIELEMKLLEGERLTTMGSIAGGIVHDFNNPVQVAMSSVQVLLDEIERRVRPEAVADTREMMSEALVALQQIRSMTQSALGYLRSGAVDDKPGEPALAARHALTLAKPSVAAASGVLRARVAASLPTVRLGTPGLTQVLVNLIVNAAQALVRERRPSYVELVVERDVVTGGVNLSVEDNGAGMPPEVLARASELFFTTKAPGVGNGLGLHNTQRLVRGAGGRMRIDSTEGAGTTVRIWLPSEGGVGAGGRVG